MSPMYCELNLTDALTFEIGHSHPAVAKIHAAQHGNRVCVWTVVDDFGRETRNLIYEAEERLMEMHPETSFDFNVVESSEYSDHLGTPLAYAR